MFSLTSHEGQNSLLPPFEIIQKYCEKNDINMVEYYGSSFQDQLRTWAFKRRLILLSKIIRENDLHLNNVLDAGAGAFLLSFPLIKKLGCRYLAIDIIPLKEMSKYRKMMHEANGEKIDVVRASVDHIPFKTDTFETCISFDVFEHLEKPQAAFKEINRVTSNKLLISLPLENNLQKIIRLPVLISEGCLNDPTATYHYIGPFKSYLEMWTRMLKNSCIRIEYAPIGFRRIFNFYAVHLCESKKNAKMSK